MSKAEIQSWISSATTSSTGNGEDQEQVWQRDQVLNDWSRSLEYAQNYLLNEKTKARTVFLRDEILSLAKHADLTLSQILDIFKLLTLTYPRYSDAASRDAVEAVAIELVRRDELRGTEEGAKDEVRLGVAEQVLGWFSNEVGKLAKKGNSDSCAPSDLFVLHSWACGLFTVCVKHNPHFAASNSWRVLAGSMGILFDMLSDSSKAKPAVKKGVLTRTRRALRAAGFSKVPEFISTLLEISKGSQTPTRMVPLLGVAVSVLIRLKNVSVEPVQRLPIESKDRIVELYTSAILMSKTSLPDHTISSLNDFVSTFITSDDFTKAIHPTIEKAMLRSPEHCLPAVTQFFVSYKHPLSVESFQRLLTQIISSAKSSNPIVRTNSVHLFKALIALSDPSDPHNLSRIAVTELIALPKTGKSAGPDHRVALYSMLSNISPATDVSSTLVDAASVLIPKEPHEGATAVLASVLPAHVLFLLHKNALSTAAVQFIAKEMTNTKVAVRKAFVGLAGSILISEPGIIESESGAAFAKGLLPSFEACLKTVSGNPLNAPGGPYEGYVAVTVLLGSFAASKQFASVIAQNPAITAITSSGVKQPFLLWDKVYQKVAEEDDELWLLKACDASLQYFSSELSKNEHLRQSSTQLGLVYIHLGVESRHPEVRKLVNSSLVNATARAPQLTDRIIREALSSFIIRASVSHKTASGSISEESSQPWNKNSRLSTLLLSIVTFGEEVGATLRENVVVELIILAHHNLICASDGQTWVDICQKAGVDPREVVDKHLDKVMRLLLDATTATSKACLFHPGFAEAAYAAVTTLAFISPALVLSCIVDQLKDDLNPDILKAISDEDLAIWATPEGTTYVDVLSSTQAEVRTNKGKDYEIAKWEEEIRKSLATKKATPVTLTRQQQALVQAQLEKEAKIRQHVSGIQSRLTRGLHLVRSLVSSRVEEFQSHMSSIVSLLLDGALNRGSFLAGTVAFETYLELAKSTTERLDSISRWIGIATLRCLQIGAVPEELQAEPLHKLVIRVLYRLRFLSEQSPFDAATFSYTFPLLSKILTGGGIPGKKGDNDEEDEDEDPLEQVALALEIIKFHCGEFSNTAFPRLQTIDNLIHVIRQQPNLGKEASSSLIELGEAIYGTATHDEIQVLLRGTLFQESYVRNSCLQAIQPFDLTEMDWSAELWIACHDDDEQNKRLARHVWDDNGFDILESFLDDLVEFLGHDNAYVRSSVAAAIAEAVEQWPQTISNTVIVLQNYYREKAKVLAPEFDQYGMVIAQSLDRADPWPARLAASQAFKQLASSFTDSEIEPFIKFLIEDQALGDRAPEVRRGMLAAGTQVIDLHGASRLAALVAIFEDRLGKSSYTSETDDFIKEAVVILLGRVARHLEASDSRVTEIVDRLVDALKTPSEQVQIAVSECLSPLVTLMRPRLPTLVDTLFDDLFNAPKYATRRGAAYGLAGVINGTGIGGMKEFNIISRLKIAAEDKKRYEPRQGVMFAFETLSNTLGRLFEPYITFVLPLLLTSFGDSTADVREAAQDASRVIMGNLSGYGVKLILPTLLEGLDEKQWRSKKGSIELLGMMAYCSPRQLSISLPIVIPRLTGVLTDSHAQVRTSANKSLKQFGEVISNPEIQSLVPVLLKALVDPAKTPNALGSLLKTSFMHYIDHSSLALVVPILERGLRERGADTKKKAAQIVGNLASLTDAKDFVPYLDELLPLVHQVLVDPVPEARATAAKALGTLVERLGEIHFPDLVPGLLRTLKTDTSGVDRQGAAQGLSEVLSGLGMERLEGLLPDIIANSRSPRPTVREGFMSLLVYLPATFGSRFQPHLPKIIAPILGGLADTEEYVREAAMRAGRMVVTNYSSKAIDLLLPELESGMFDPGWRIRQSSITLVGELLFKVSGISGKTSELDEDEAAAEATTAESSRRALLEVLGAERRDRILAALYLVRQDGVVVVRQSSIQIWKALVHNTPKTVRELLPELVTQIIFLISSDEFEQQETASRTVAEVCRKFGERIIGDIMPILKTKATSSDPRTREGVSLTVSQIMQNSTETQREDHEDDIISIVRAALVDDEANVRTAGAQAFDVLQEELGTKAIDQTIPTLLEALRQPGKSSGTALQALTEVMNVRATTVFPVLIPTLTAIPMTVFNARALASLVTVAGNALSKRLTTILNALVKVSEDDIEDELREAVGEATEALFSSVNDAEGLNTVMMLLIGWAKHESPKRRVSACNLFTVFCQASELDSSLYRVDWIRQLVSLLDDSQVDVYTAAWNAFDSFVKSMPKDELEPLVVPLRRTIESTGAPGRTVPGFDLPKGVAPTVPIIIAGLTTGSNEQREQAAYAIGDLVERTEENAMKPFVVPFTGPLIRVATQAMGYPPGVKIAILSALTSMLERIPAFVKPFFPQLQRTFVKSTSDPASAAVRAKAAEALGVLMKNQPRVDPVITELITGAKGNEDSISTSFIWALSHVMHNASQNVGDKARESCIELVAESFRETHSEHYCEAVGALVKSLSDKPDLLRTIVETHLIFGTPPSIMSSQVILGVIREDDDADSSERPNLFQKLKLLRAVAQKVLESAAHEKPFIARPAREARDLIKELDDASLLGLF
ncbi:eIF-2-alpha kinase activator gcn1 [Psilocybe cubensis]|uniref:TOG domain-containing protein n=2 Tax=Psilocybe cubensis TaxID=181762 RepID=A0A8H7Y5G3_PSICU|nr:eIF-2-alpha kinase activator gcn1 [Psilocybe cubensis]KAH9485783.1 eIF-2-alpha kinase activator gcn1 [Psilocybe cubensis]